MFKLEINPTITKEQVRAFSKFLKDYRTKNKMSIRDLSKKLCVSESVLARYEVEQLYPDYWTLIHFQNVLECDFNDFF